MRLTNRVYLVGSGTVGFDMTHPLDCHVYLIDGGDELALIDGGIGMATDDILRNAEEDGLDTDKIKYIILTHGHVDHAGGTAAMVRKLGCQAVASKETANFIRNGDEEGVSLSFAKQAGFYPADYVFEACPVQVILKEGDTLQVGDLQIEAFETPGHCCGMLSLQMKTDGKTYLFVGDTVFWGGKIILQNIYDCNIQDYQASVKKLSKLSVDVFLPGHLAFSLKNGQRHINAAAEAFQKLMVPENLV